MWDSTSETPYWNRPDGTQVWFDNVKSLCLKTLLAESMGIAGMAMWVRSPNVVYVFEKPKVFVAC